jgi:cytoskeleton protein RodZ
MAPKLGQVLREARTQRGIELSEVERSTKIRVKFLRAMEEDRWDALPAPAYARGFLSAYARFLGLDDQELVNEYRRTIEPEDRPAPIPYKVVQPGLSRRRRSVKPVVLLLTGLVAAVVLGLLIAGSLGGSDNGGDVAERRDGPAAGSRTDQLPTTQASEVSLELRATEPVWVCLVDDAGQAQVNGETLAANEVRGPFEGRAFEVTFGNGAVEMTVNGEPTEIPPVAEPLGYRITPSGVGELPPSSQPTCL